MDARRFDDLSAQLAALTSRRRLLVVLAALPIGGWLRSTLEADAGVAAHPVERIQKRRDHHRRRARRRQDRQHEQQTRDNGSNGDNVGVGDRCYGPLRAAGCTQPAANKPFQCPLYVNLRGLDLQGCDYNSTPLIRADFTSSNLSRAVFAAAQLNGSSFHLANLATAILLNADLTGASFRDANVEGVNWTNATCPDGTKAADHGQTCCGHLIYDTDGPC